MEASGISTNNVHSFSYRCSSGECREAADLGRLITPDGFQQFMIPLLDLKQVGTEQGHGRNHATWFLVDLWAPFSSVQPEPSGRASTIYPGTFRPLGRTIVVAICLLFKVALHSEFKEFHSCALCQKLHDGQIRINLRLKHFILNVCI